MPRLLPPLQALAVSTQGGRCLGQSFSLTNPRSRPFRRVSFAEGAGLALGRFHRLAQLRERGVGETGADLAGVHDLAVVVVADEERPRQPAALALAFQPPADHQLLAHAVLDLDPEAA